jgi:DNA-binding NarL/FixJ family response regulator
VRILIVDDHAGFRRFARAFLEAAGHEVVGESGTAAAAIAAARRLRPDAVLLDVGLPDMDGFEVARELAGGPAVVLTSSRSAAEYGSRMSTTPAAGFIAKSDLSRAALGRLLEEPPCAS